MMRWQDKAFMKSMWVVLDCGIKSYKQIIEYIDHWMFERLRLVSKTVLPTRKVLRELWTLVGADPFITDEIAALRFVVRDGYVYVCDEVASTKESLLKRLRFLLLSLWRLRKYCEARWITVGRCTQFFLGGLLSGLFDIAQCILEDEGQSNYYISGMKRLNDDVRLCIVTVALASGPADASLRLALEDSRVLKRHVDMKVEVREEMCYLAGISEPVWEILAEVSNSTVARIRTEVLGCAHVSIAFIFFRVFDQLLELPCSLFVGDLDENLELLYQGTEPDDALCSKVWRLLHTGWNREDIKSALGMVIEARWGSDISEECHCAAAMQAKYHPEITEEALRVRAHAYQSCRLLPTACECEKKLTKLRTRLLRLRRRQPLKCGARQMFCGELVKISSQWKGQGRIGVQKTIQKDVIKQHNQVWKKTSALKKAKFATQARLHQAKVMMETGQETEELQDELLLTKARNAVESKGTTPLFVRSCKFTQADVGRLDETFKNGHFTHAVVTAQRARQLKELPPPTSTIADKIYKGYCARLV